MAAITVKALGDSASKWGTNSGSGAARYMTHAAAAAAKFVANAEAAAGSFQQAVTSGNIGARYMSGLRKNGATRYATGIAQKGSRYGQGVGTPGAQQAWQSGFTPFATALGGMDPGPRGPRGDPKNGQRSLAVQQLLHNLRISMLSAGG